MIIAASIKQLLESYKVAYRVLQHKRVSSIEMAANVLKLGLARVLTVQVLADSAGVLLMVHPLTRAIDFTQCNQLFNRELKVLPAVRVNRIFNDCEAGCWPAIGQAYDLEVIIDQTVSELDHVYFASGSHTALLQIAAEDYFSVNSRAKVLLFTVPRASETATVVAYDHEHEHTEILANLAFPELPPVAMHILQLALNKEHSIKELIELVAQDQAIQEQIKYYTQLPFVQARLNQQNNPAVSHVVEHILGFDMVSHIALGVAAGRAFNLERAKESEDFWRHAFYAATYAERITELVADSQHLDPAISFLAGLFHNFGLLLFSQLFPPEYALLQKWLRLNPKTPIEVLEKRLLGMGAAFNIVRGGHAQLGAWLLRNWRMPESICIIAAEHHSAAYNGKYAAYVQILRLVNQLLRLDGIGDGTTLGVDEKLLAALGLTSEQVVACVTQIKAGSVSLDNMAKSLSKQ
jgi:HD-like signal output (HDOD) protein/prolyl-tRNA editing enzyme YbaK/EbsC (Cys-tRNA(Pro) deacylase)